MDGKWVGPGAKEEPPKAKVGEVRAMRPEERALFTKDVEAEFLGYVEGGASVTEALDCILWQATGQATLPSPEPEQEEPTRVLFLRDAGDDGAADLQALA